MLKVVHIYSEIICGGYGQLKVPLGGGVPFSLSSDRPSLPLLGDCVLAGTPLARGLAALTRPQAGPADMTRAGPARTTRTTRGAQLQEMLPSDSHAAARLLPPGRRHRCLGVRSAALGQPEVAALALSKQLPLVGQ